MRGNIGKDNRGGGLTEMPMLVREEYEDRMLTHCLDKVMVMVMMVMVVTMVMAVTMVIMVMLTRRLKGR